MSSKVQMIRFRQPAECLLNNEINVAKTLLRDYVNATLGFKQLGALMGKKTAKPYAYAQ